MGYNVAHITIVQRTIIIDNDANQAYLSGTEVQYIFLKEKISEWPHSFKDAHGHTLGDLFLKRNDKMMDGIDTMKATVEKMTTASNQAFKDGVEKSLSALNDVNSQSKANIEAVVESMTAATKGAETVGAQVLAYSKKSWEDAVSASKSLSSAKSLQEVVELQSSFAKSALEAYVAELNAMSEAMSSSFKDSVKPINARVSAVVEKFQSVK